MLRTLGKIDADLTGFPGNLQPSAKSWIIIDKSLKGDGEAWQFVALFKRGEWLCAALDGLG